MLRKVAFVSLVTTVLVAPMAALADQGDIDTSYGTAGTIEFTVDPSGEPLTVVSMHVDDDGSAIVVGSHEGNSTEQYLWVGRVAADGSAVDNFAPNAPGAAFSEGSAATVDSSGRVIVAGNAGGAGGTSTDMFVSRFTASGDPDTTFDSDGNRTIDTGNADWATSVLVQGNGSIVVAGFTDATTPASIRMARLTSSGALDSSFGPLGIVTIPWEDAGGVQREVIDVDLSVGESGAYLLTVLGSDPGSYIGTMVVDSSGDEVSSNLAWQNVATATRIDSVQRDDGKVVTAAHAYDSISTDHSIELFRFNRDGSDDTSFGSGTLPVSHVLDAATGTRAAITETRTGELVVAYDRADAGQSVRLQAFTEDGASYDDWGTNGVVDLDGSTFTASRDLGRQPSGGVLALHWELFDIKAIFGPGSVTRVEGDDSGRFVDDDGTTHEANIEVIAADGITSGCDASDQNLYCPDDAVTRGQMATFLARAANLPAAPDDGPFTDTANSPHAANIAAIEAAGITQGCDASDPTRFCPNDTVTRGQMATFLDRAFDLANRFPVTDPDPFADDNGNTHEASIAVLYATGVTTGCDPADLTRYCPIDDVTRGQMATFLVRTMALP